MRIDVHFNSDIPRKFRDVHQERINEWLAAVSRGGSPFLYLSPRVSVLAGPLTDPSVAAVDLVTLHATHTKLYDAGEIDSVGDRIDVILAPGSKPLVEAWMKADA